MKKKTTEQLDLFEQSERSIMTDIRNRRREGRAITPKHDAFLREHYAPYGVTANEKEQN